MGPCFMKHSQCYKLVLTLNSNTCWRPIGCSNGSLSIVLTLFRFYEIEIRIAKGKQAVSENVKGPAKKIHLPRKLDFQRPR